MTKAAKNTAKTHARPVQLVALANCVVSSMNPRQSVPDDEVATLADSIRMVGLIQNLSGFTEPDGKIGIVAGGKRLRALHRIAADDQLDAATVKVPVMLADSETEALAWATTENVARTALHPADEVIAYRKMDAAGVAVTEIAKAFAVTERHVKGRMRLAGLAEPILDALRNDEITLDLAAAYTVSADPAAQSAVFEELNGDRWDHNARTVRSRLTTDAADSEGKLAKFVGRERYEAEGGAVREDLFGEDSYFLDIDLLRRIADEQLNGIRTDHIAAGWKWVEIYEERPPWDAMSKMDRTYPEPVEFTDEQASRYDELAERVEVDAATEVEVSEFDALQGVLDREDYSNEQMAHAGVFLWIGYHGTVEAEYGLIHDSDREAAIAAGAMQETRHASVSATPKASGPYSAALVDDLCRIRTGAAQTALLDHPDLALDLLTFALSVPVYSSTLPLGIRAEDAKNAPDKDEGLNLPKPLQPQEYGSPIHGEDAVDAFTAFRRKKPATKARILTENIARILSVGPAGDPASKLTEMIAGLAGIDVRRVWTPTADFLGRLKASQLDEIMAHIAGEPVSTAFAKMKKGEKVQRLHNIFKGETGIPPLTDAQRARADAWTPEGMVWAAEAEDGTDTRSQAA